jgi:hypothetical protein
VLTTTGDSAPASADAARDGVDWASASEAQNKAAAQTTGRKARGNKELTLLALEKFKGMAKRDRQHASAKKEWQQQVDAKTPKIMPDRGWPTSRDMDT